MKTTEASSNKASKKGNVLPFILYFQLYFFVLLCFDTLDFIYPSFVDVDYVACYFQRLAVHGLCEDAGTNSIFS